MVEERLDPRLIVRILRRYSMRMLAARGTKQIADFTDTARIPLSRAQSADEKSRLRWPGNATVQRRTDGIQAAG